MPVASSTAATGPFGRTGCPGAAVGGAGAAGAAAGRVGSVMCGRSQGQVIGAFLVINAPSSPATTATANAATNSVIAIRRAGWLRIRSRP
jgi:hypothetical protein